MSWKTNLLGASLSFASAGGSRILRSSDEVGLLRPGGKDGVAPLISLRRLPKLAMHCFPSSSSTFELSEVVLIVPISVVVVLVVLVALAVVVVVVVVVVVG